MKFLVLAKWRASGAPPDPKLAIMMNDASKAWIKAQLAAGHSDVIYSVLPSASGYYGMGILNAQSLEAVQKHLVSYPAYLMTDFEVYGLSDVEQAIDDTSAAIKKMMGGA